MRWPLLLLLLSRFSGVWLCATPQMASYQAPLSLRFSRQEHWSGLPFPSPISPLFIFSKLGNPSRKRKLLFPHGNHTEWLVHLFFTFLYCMNFSHGILSNKLFNTFLKNQSYEHQYKKLHGQTIVYLALPLVESLSHVWLWPHGLWPTRHLCWILQARILEWVAISFFRGFSRPRNWTRISASAGRFFITEPPVQPQLSPYCCIFIFFQILLLQIKLQSTSLHFLRPRLWLFMFGRSPRSRIPGLTALNIFQVP